MEAFKNDPRERKVNLGIGVYTNDGGDPYVFPVVRKVGYARLLNFVWILIVVQVEKELQQKELDKEYAGILGYSTFTNAALELVLGKDDQHVKEHTVHGIVLMHCTLLLMVLLSFIFYLVHHSVVFVVCLCTDNCRNWCPQTYGRIFGKEFSCS